MSFHLTPSGDPGICRATKACPFGGPTNHYPTEKDAREAFESANQPFSLKLPRSGFTPKTLTVYETISQAWLNKLDAKELKAITDYTQICYSDINSALWRDEAHHEAVKHLDLALMKSTSVDFPLYRRPVVSGSREEVKELLAQWQEDEVLEFKGFTSTSAHPMGLSSLLHRRPVANAWASEEDLKDFDETHKNVIFQLEVEKAAPVGCAGSHPQELEFLIARGANFRVGSMEESTFVIERDILTGVKSDSTVEVPVTVVQLSQIS